MLLGISGGIAAYKSAELVRKLRGAGAEVRVVMTAAATEFITPLTLQALSGNPVGTDLLDERAEAAMGHIELSRWADIILIAPCTADFLARLVQGRSDDLLGACCLAAACRIAIAPAMNKNMWDDPATQRNLATAKRDDTLVFGPGSGEQACGEIGEGRMLEPEQLVACLAGGFESGLLAGQRVLVTAGPTYEDIDPVRYIGNRSSGKMGFAVAEAARDAGARVVLVAGPVALPDPERIACRRVRSALEMRQAVMAEVMHADLYISAAAIADYRPAQRQPQKIKKQGGGLQLELVPNPDILAEVAALEGGPFTVGFAAETEQLDRFAESKRLHKGVDLIAANLVGVTGVGFDSEQNQLKLFWSGGSLLLPNTSKANLARLLIERIAGKMRAQD